MSDIEEVWPFQCDKCSTKFKSQKELGIHKQRKNGKRMVCDECCELFVSTEKLTDHINSVHVKKLCEQCLECFDSMSEENLDLHMKGTCQVGCPQWWLTFKHYTVGRH